MGVTMNKRKEIKLFKHAAWRELSAVCARYSIDINDYKLTGIIFDPDDNRYSVTFAGMGWGVIEFTSIFFDKTTGDFIQYHTDWR
jgi:hypothetical protein